MTFYNEKHANRKDIIILQSWTKPSQIGQGKKNFISTVVRFLAAITKVSKCLHPNLWFFNYFLISLSGLRQFLANERSLKLIKNAFYFILKGLFVLKIKIFVLTFGHIEKRLGEKDKVNFKIHDVTPWLINSCNILRYRNELISQEVKTIRQ